MRAIALFFLLVQLTVLAVSAQDTVAKRNASDADVKFSARYSAAELEAAPVKLIPYPNKVEWGTNSILLTAWNPVFPDSLPKNIIDEFYGISVDSRLEINSKSEFKIEFLADQNLEKEAYRLECGAAGIQVFASTEAGCFYALQTLRQLIGKTSKGAQVQLCRIEDQPAYPLRGFMIDTGRNFQSIESLKKIIDVMALYKLNTFHWHLTDYPAWRIESKIYPQLTAAENHRPTRDPGMFYTYEQIRELSRYAAQKQIAVLPEIDMPGHSTAFTTAMGFKMASPEGMAALENILNEFFSEIPREMAPVIHIGSDEIHISNPDEFVQKMVGVVEADSREAVVWSPGLHASETVIRQSWGGAEPPTGNNLREIDSRKSYMNGGEPMTYIQSLFFRPLGNDSGNQILGGIVCLWPDVNLVNENDAFTQNPFLSGLLTYSWASWTADVVSAPSKYMYVLPEANSTAFCYFKAFEAYLLDHKQRYFGNEPFIYQKQTDKRWKLAGPFAENVGDEAYPETEKELSKLMKRQKLEWKAACGNTLVMKERWSQDGYFPDAQPGQSVYASTFLYSDSEKTMDTRINFETPLRANRVYAGIPQNSSWDNNGGELWINGAKLPGPEWKNPGWRSSKKTGWGTPDEQEIPWADEELYWLRQPAKICLKKGWNEIVVRIPYANDFQNWMFTFIPLDMSGLYFSPEKTFDNKIENNRN